MDSPELRERYGPLVAFACQGGCGVLVVRRELLVGLHCYESLIAPARYVVHGAFRCEVHNRAVGGDPRSWHKIGGASDGHVEDPDHTVWPVESQYQAALEVPAFAGGGIGVYEDWTHPGLHTDVRSWVSRWGHYEGEYHLGIEGLEEALRRAGERGA